MSKEAPGVRYAEAERETTDVRVRVVLDLDGERKSTIDTGIGFLDHMLTQFAFHGRFDLGVSAEGDLHVDEHHTVEGVAICMGRAIRQALGEAEGISRFGSVAVPVDEALVLTAVDISGRPCLSYNVQLGPDRLGGLSAESVQDFLQALVNHGGFTLHLHQMAGRSNHHICESIFKGLGRALGRAIAKGDASGVPSTKGVID